MRGCVVRDFRKWRMVHEAWVMPDFYRPLVCRKTIHGEAKETARRLDGTRAVRSTIPYPETCTITFYQIVLEMTTSEDLKYTSQTKAILGLLDNQSPSGHIVQCS